MQEDVVQPNSVDAETAGISVIQASALHGYATPGRSSGYTRRAALVSLAALASSSTRLAANGPGALLPLKDVAQNAGLEFGAAFDVEHLANRTYMALLRKHISVMTPENSLKFVRLRRHGEAADFRNSDQILRFASRMGCRIRGHTLVWNDNNPLWLVRSSSGKIAYWMERHIEEVVGRYGGEVAWWDVVNEPFNMWSRQSEDYRDGPWFAAMGPNYIPNAFRAARAAAPNARLFINETFTEQNTELGFRTRSSLLRLVDELQHMGIQLDGIGLQGHLKPERGWGPDQFARFLDELASRKLDVHITELDCDDATLPPNPEERDAVVAQHYGNFLQTVLRCKAVSVLETWGLSDLYSQYRRRALVSSDMPRALPFDVSMAPKTAAQSIINALEARSALQP